MSITFTTTSQNSNYDEVLNIEPDEVKEHSSSITLIDVREPDEFTGELGHITGSELIPLGELEAKLGSISKENPIVFICRSGNRSGKATQMALASGHTNVFNMNGGMLLWNKKEFAITTEG